MKNKRNKGITLIALVVTIIVLLLLAGISIQMLTGNNGILNRATEAKIETRGGTVQEKVVLWKNEKIAKNMTNTGTVESLEQIVNRLVSEKLLTEDEKDQILGNETKGIEATGQVTIGSRTIVFDTTKTLVEAFKDEEIKVGDYITNYNSTLKNSSASVSVGAEKTGHTGIQQYQVDTNTTWRVLGLDETGTKLIITTGSPIKKVMKSTGEDWEKDPYLYLSSAEGWYWAGEATSGNILDEICAIYDGRFADSTKSIRAEEINTALGITLDKENNIIYKIDDESKTAINTYQGFFGQSYIYKNGDYAPENYLKAKYPSNSTYSSMTNKKINDSVAGKGYQYSSADIIDQSSKLYEVLFDGTSGSSNGKSYWLASSGVLKYLTSYCVFGPGAVGLGYISAGSGMFVSNGLSTTMWLAVRPVVYLQSGVIVDDLSISSSGNEQEWTTTIPNSYSGVTVEYGQITE